MSSDPDNNITSWSWSFGDGGTSSTQNPTHTYAVTLTVTDAGGLSNSQTTTVAVNNVAPMSNITGAPDTNPEGTAIALSGSATDPSSVDTAAGFTYAWNVTKNGNSYASGSGTSFSFTPDDNATYVVTLNATDKDSGTGSTSKPIAVTNVAPSVNAGTGATINEGATFSSSGSFTDPGADTWTATVDYGDGSGVQTLSLNLDKAFSLSHVYADNGNYTVTVKVTDKDGDVGTGTAVVTVNNVAPASVTVSASPATINENDTTTVSGSFTDLGTLDTHTVVITWGDDSPNTTINLAANVLTFSTSHQYLDNKPADAGYTVNVTVTDKDGTSSSSSTTVTVNNVAPIVSAFSGAALFRGQTYTASGSFTDPGADTWTATVNYGDGTGDLPLALSGKSFSLSHTYLVLFPHTVKVTIRDDDGAVGSATATVTVNPQFVVFSTELTWLREGVKVISGDVGANASLPEPKGKRPRNGHEGDDDPEDKDRDKRVEVIVGEHVQMLQDISNVVGDTVWLRNDSEVYNVYYNELIKNKKATILGSKNTPLTLPLLQLPALPTITPGTQDIEVKQKETFTLSPGSYRKITVKQGGTLILTGGTYQVSTLDIRENTNILFKGKSEVRVKSEMDTDAKTYIGPDPSAPALQAHDIVFYLEGTDDKGRWHDDDHGPGKKDEEVSPTVVQIGVKNTLLANIYAPNGTVWLKEGTKGTGAFIGKRVRIGEKVELTLDSAF